MSTPGRGCARCVLPAGYRGLRLQADGVCNYCHTWDALSERLCDWERLGALREERLVRARAAPGDYDCLVGLSGGKDSSWVALKLKDLGLRVLGFTFDNGFLTEQGRANVARVVGALGVDHFFHRVDIALHRDFYRAAVRFFGTPCPACSYAGYALMNRIAFERGIPLVVHGRSRPQMFRSLLPGSPDAFLPYVRGNLSPYDVEAVRAASLSSKRRLDLFVRIAFAERELRARFYREFYPDLGAWQSAPQVPEFLGWFLFQPYDEAAMKAELSARLGWRPAAEGTTLTHEDCAIHGAADHLYRRVFGHPQLAPELSVLIREGAITRAEAVARLERDAEARPDVEASLARLGAALGYSREQIEGFAHSARRRDLWRNRWVGIKGMLRRPEPVLG